MKVAEATSNGNGSVERIGGFKFPRIIILTVLAYEALGAMLGGILLVVTPDGRSMDMPVEIMHGVFKDFLIPGIILLLMGFLNAFAFIAVLRKWKSDWILCAMAMKGFIIWFAVEIIVLNELHWLHLMWGLPVVLGTIMMVPNIRNNSFFNLRTLLYCGILSSVYYILLNIFVPMWFEGYSQSSQTVSELSALGAPTRIAWVLLVIIYVLLFGSFGWGVLISSVANRRLRIVGVLMIFYSIFNMYWPPMHLRGNEPTLTDTLHIVWASSTVGLMILIMGFAAGVLGRRFKIYTIISIGLHVVFGILTGMLGPNIAKNLPTPMIGVYERINIFIFMLWIIVFSYLLLKADKRKSIESFNR